MNFILYARKTFTVAQQTFVTNLAIVTWKIDLNFSISIWQYCNN